MLTFSAPVQPVGNTGSLVHHCLYVPAEVVAAATASGTRRLVGTLNGQPFNLALHNEKGQR